MKLTLTFTIIIGIFYFYFLYEEMFQGIFAITEINLLTLCLTHCLSDRIFIKQIYGTITQMLDFSANINRKVNMGYPDKNKSINK